MDEDEDPPLTPGEVLTAGQFGRFLAVRIRGRMTQWALVRAVERLRLRAPADAPVLLTTQRISAMERSGGGLPTRERLRSYVYGCGAGERYEELEAVRQRLLRAQVAQERARIVGGGVASARAAVPVALAGLPPDEGFTGREGDLGVLRDVLAPDRAGTAGRRQDARAAVALVAGLAGVGKTSLVVAAAQQALDAGWFPGGVLFVDLHGYDAGGGVDATSAVAALLVALGIGREAVPATLGEREALYRSELVELARRGLHVLVVVDNASDAGQVRSLRPPGSAHRMLVTSRDTLPVQHARRVELEALSVQDAIELLANELAAAHPGDERIASEPEAARELAQLCGRLPLALRIAVMILADRATQPVHALTRQLRSARDRLGELEYGDSLAVRMAFDTSLRRLPAEQARLFRFAALHPGPQVPLGALAALADLPPDAARQLVTGVVRAHLLQHSAIEGSYRFHDLVRLYAAERCEQQESAEDRAAARVRLLDQYCAMSAASNSLLDPRIPATERSPLFPDASSAQEWADAELPNVVAVALLAVETENYRRACDLAASVTYSMHLGRHFEEWIIVSECELTAARQLGDGRVEARALNVLGLAHQGLRRFDQAIGSLRDSAAVSRRIRDPLGEAKALSNLGAVEGELDRWEPAIEYFLRAHELFESADDVVGTCQSLSNLGYAYTTLGQAQRAFEFYGRTLIVVEGFDQGYTLATVLTNVGESLRALRRFDEALEHHERALAIFVRLKDRHHEARTLHNVALVHRDLGQLDEAEAGHRRALPIRREVRDRHGEGLTLENLALVFAERAATAEARTCLDQALGIFTEIEATADAERVRRRMGEG